MNPVLLVWLPGEQLPGRESVPEDGRASGAQSTTQPWSRASLVVVAASTERLGLLCLHLQAAGAHLALERVEVAAHLLELAEDQTRVGDGGAAC